MKNNHFIAISACYNVTNYIDKSVRSVMTQKYDNFDYMLVEDNSIDGTREKVIKLQKEFGFNVCYNPVRTESPVGNFAKGINLMPGNGDDIFVTVDGDDWLVNNEVFAYLDTIYRDPEVLMTYGSFISASGKLSNYCQPVSDTRNYRKGNLWCTSHLRTIKRKLWDRINQEDLKDGNGKYYVYYPDLAYVLPAIEMAGPRRARFIGKILYVYNDLSPLCSADDWKKGKIAMKHVYDVAKEIRRKPVYPQLREL
jgi:glycosyltransferase involved in cell wall biosynthesis